MLYVLVHCALNHYVFGTEKMKQKTEQELKEAGVAYKAGSFPFKALGRARAGGDLDRFVKILADAKTDEVLGVHMIGARCADLIAEAVTGRGYSQLLRDSILTPLQLDSTFLDVYETIPFPVAQPWQAGLAVFVVFSRQLQAARQQQLQHHYVCSKKEKR